MIFCSIYYRITVFILLNKRVCERKKKVNLARIQEEIHQLQIHNIFPHLSRAFLIDYSIFSDSARRSHRRAAPSMSTVQSCAAQQMPACRSSMAHIRAWQSSPFGCPSFRLKLQLLISDCRKLKAGRCPRITTGKFRFSILKFHSLVTLNPPPMQCQQQDESTKARLQLEPSQRRLC